MTVSPSGPTRGNVVDSGSRNRSVTVPVSRSAPLRDTASSALPQREQSPVVAPGRGTTRGGRRRPRPVRRIRPVVARGSRRPCRRPPTPRPARWRDARLRQAAAASDGAPAAVTGTVHTSSAASTNTSAACRPPGAMLPARTPDGRASSTTDGAPVWPSPTATRTSRPPPGPGSTPHTTGPSAPSVSANTRIRQLLALHQHAVAHAHRPEVDRAIAPGHEIHR